ncbi:DUF3299 domain-containing protein [Reichenbachiella versicolor]|uniref:DUF3299 domain-containing protein n=1 Tax=Reichenbachiella versicolor TaxID=1821036 RepID=UPI000D6E9D47|nr:DUF3299 domain-containing protein [Reichenbachiella versicolor]
MLRLSLIILMLLVSPAFAQIKITWETLADVSFTDKWSEEEQGYYYYPHFGPRVKAMRNKEIFLRGYMLPLEPEEGFYVLSKNPYASCFFCGSGGPETIAQIRFKPGHPKFKMDQIVTVKGILKLNKDDVYTCNYLIDEAEVF